MIKHIYVSSVSEKGKTSKTIVEKGEQALDFAKNSKLSWFNFVIGDISLGTEMIAKELRLSLEPGILLSGYLSSYEDKNDILGMMLPIVRSEKGEVTISPILIYLQKNKLITIHDEYTEHLLRLSQYSDSFMRKIPITGTSQGPQTLLLARIIDEISERNFRALRGIIEQAEIIQIELARTQTPPRRLSVEIFNVKQSVLTFLNAVWAIRDVVHSLRYGDADMISDDSEELVKFDIILADLDRQLSMAENVLEVLAGGISVLQAMFTSNLQSTSNRMTSVLLWLTIFGTAILLPNTLATIYGIPFLPLENNFNSLLLIVLSLGIVSGIGTWFVYYYVKKVWKPDYINE